MNIWIHEVLDFLKTLVNESPSAVDWALFGSVVMVAALVMLKLMGLATGNARSTWLLNLLVLFVSAASILVAVAAGRLWLAPVLTNTISSRLLDLLCVAFGGLVLATPLFCLLQRVRYMTALMTLLVAGVTAGLVYLWAVSTVMGGRGARKVIDAIYEKREQMETPAVSP